MNSHAITDGKAGTTALIVLIASVTWQLSPLAVAQDHGYIPRKALEQELEAAAAKAFEDVPGQIAISAYDSKVASWHLSLRKDGLREYLAQQPDLPAGTLMDQLTAWARQVNTEIGRITRECFQRNKCIDFNYDLDCALWVDGRVLPEKEYGTDWLFLEFEGPRLSFVGTPEAELLFFLSMDDGVQTTDHRDMTDEKRAALRAECEATAREVSKKFPQPDPPLEDNPNRMTYEIQPDKPIWALHEQITGTITLRNTGTTRLHVESRWGPSTVAMTTAAGEQPKRYFMQGCILYGPKTSWYVYWLPGKSITSRFEIDTDRASH